MKNALVEFLAEFAIRLFSSKPRFFVIVQWISTFVAGISSGITYWQSLGKELPVWVGYVGNVNVIVGAAIAIIIAQLTNKDPEVAAKLEKLDSAK